MVTAPLPQVLRAAVPGQEFEAAVEEVKGRRQQKEISDLGEVEQPGVGVGHQELPGETVPENYRVAQGPFAPIADKGVQIPQGQDPPAPDEPTEAAEAFKAGTRDFPDEEEQRRGEQQVGGLVDVRAFGGPLEAQRQGRGRRHQQKGKTAETAKSTV